MNKKKIVEVKGLTVSYNGKRVFEDISFHVGPGQLVGIIGPNGAGKSTLIKAIMGLVNKDAGSISIKDLPINKVRKQIAYVPQRSAIDMDFPVLVEEVVMMGRYPYLSWWGYPKEKDKAMVKRCLQQVGMWDLRSRQIGQLSGGQQQRVFLARALAQEAQLFFLDEPFAGIDAASEKMIMEILREVRSQGKTLFVVHHDLNKAESYFDSMILLKNKLVAFGKKEDVLKVDTLQEAYGGSLCAIAAGEGLMVVNG